MTNTISKPDDAEVAEFIGAAVADLYNAHEDEVQNRANSIVAYLYINGVFDRWAPKITQKIGWHQSRREEVKQVMIVRLLDHLNERTDRLYKATVRKENPAAGMSDMLSSLVHQYSRSAAEAGMAGGASVMRRNDRYRKFEGLVAHELGRTPTVEEVIERSNQDAIANTSNPRKTGVLLDGTNHRLDVGYLHEETQIEATDLHIDPEVLGYYAASVREISTTLNVFYPARPELIATLNAWFRGHQEGQIAFGRDEHLDLAVLAGLTPEDARDHLRCIHHARDEFAARVNRSAA